MSKSPEDIAPDPRDPGRPARGELQTLTDYLRSYRLTLQMKCEDLDAEQLSRRSVPPSTLSLLGIVRHLADVERYWFRAVVLGHEDIALYWTDEDTDADFNEAAADPELVADAWRQWHRETAHTDSCIAEATSLDEVVRNTSRGALELREVIVHLIEEYARHCGHADLLRECIDGRTGQ